MNLDMQFFFSGMSVSAVLSGATGAIVGGFFVVVLSLFKECVGYRAA